jgi:hypothetical protein
MRGETPRDCRPHLSPLAGRGRIASALRVRGTIRKRGRDRFKDSRLIPEHVIVPESQNSVVMLDKPFVTDRISWIVGMLSAINLDDQSTIATDKVCGIGTNRFLPDKLIPVKPPCPKAVPEHPFRIRRRASQSPRPVGFYSVSTAHLANPPHPPRSARRPLPASGERQRYDGNI